MLKSTEETVNAEEREPDDDSEDRNASDIYEDGSIAVTRDVNETVRVGSDNCPPNEGHERPGDGEDERRKDGGHPELAPRSEEKEYQDCSDGNEGVLNCVRDVLKALEFHATGEHPPVDETSHGDHEEGVHP